MEKTIDLSICIVSWRVKDLLKNCLDSIYNKSWKINFETFVIDNNSCDGTAEMVKEYFPQVNFVQNRTNDGFTKTNNILIKESRGRYVLLLNPDTIIHPNSLDKMAEFMDVHPEAGAMGPKLLNSDGTLQKSCMGLPTLSALVFRNLFIEALAPWNKISRKYLMKDFTYDQTKIVDQPMGAALIIRKSILDNVGLMDENIMMFFDEVDLCCRIKNAGWKIYFYPDAIITHYGGQSIKSWTPFRLGKTWNKSRNYYFGKHFGKWAVIILKLSDMLKAIILLVFASAFIYLIFKFYSIIKP